MTSRRDFIKLTTATAVLSLTTPPLAISAEDQGRVLILLKTLDNPFFREIADGFRENWTPPIALEIRSGRNESDLQSQKEIMESFILKYVRQRRNPLLKGIVISPAGSGGALTGLIAEARRAAVPVVVVDTDIDHDALKAAHTDYNLLLASDNHSGGVMAGEAMVDALSRIASPRLLLLNGVMEQETAVKRRAGFLDAISKLGWPAPTERTASWRRNEARMIVDVLKTSQRLPDGIFAANDEMAIGALEALRGENKTPVVIGFDAIPEARELVRTKQIFATVAQQPREMGRLASIELANLISTPSSETMLRKSVPLSIVK